MNTLSCVCAALVLIQMASAPSCTAQQRKAKKPAPAISSVTATENKGKAFEVADYFNGYNTQMMRGPAWKAPGFIDRVKMLYPGTLRYPGGTVANYWDWKTGWLMEESRNEWKSIAKNPITLEDIKYACDQTGAEPLFVLNMLTSTLPSQLEMLRHAQSLGMQVKFVELGNEFYLGDGDYVKKYPGGKDYALECNKWIAAIKKEFPGARIGIVGYSMKEGAAKKEQKHANRTNNWNQEVISTVSGADAMTFHIYGGTGLNYIAKVRLAEEDDAEPGNEKAAQMQQAFERPAAHSIVMGIPYNRWNTSNSYDYKILPKGMKAWITEYNLFEREGVVAGTWAHGLYAVTQTMLFMENPSTELVCYHNLTTSAQFGAIFNNAQGFDKAYRKKSVKAFDFSASGHTLAFAGKALSDAGRATKIDFSNSPQMNAARGQKYPALNGWMIKRKSGKRVLVTNLSNESIKVDFSSLIQGVKYSMIHANPADQVGSDADLKKSEGSGSQITLAPYSVTVIEGE